MKSNGRILHNKIILVGFVLRVRRSLSFQVVGHLLRDYHLICRSISVRPNYYRYSRFDRGITTVVILPAAGCIFILIGLGPERLVLAKSALTTGDPAYYCLSSCLRHEKD